jgi:hypothetical protein
MYLPAVSQILYLLLVNEWNYFLDCQLPDQFVQELLFKKEWTSSWTSGSDQGNNVHTQARIQDRDSIMTSLELSNV